MAQYDSYQNQQAVNYPPALPSDKPPAELDTNATRIEALANHANLIGNRLELLGDRIFGGAVTGNQEAKAGPKPVPNGVLQVMSEALDHLAFRLDRLDNLAARLDRLA